MKEIYYLEGEKIYNKEKYIVTFIKGGCKQTLYRDTGFIQCREGTYRSFIDLYRLFKSKFKTATKGELARILLNKKYPFISIFYCDSIDKMVIGHKSVIDSFINNQNSMFPENTGIRGRYMNEDYVKKGPNFEKLLRHALRSRKFSLNNINLNPIRDYEKDLL